MAIISYDYGHLEGGQDTSANGIVYEYAEIRRYAPVCISELEQAGHTCVNCTPPDNQGYTLQQSLSYRTDKANASGSVLHICFHVNAFQHVANPMGAEVEVASNAGAIYGQAVLAEICKLGFIRRGVNTPNLWVTKNTNMTAILIEPFFCDSEADVALYNPQTLGSAIANGVISVLGKGDAKPSQPIVTPVVNAVPNPVQSQPVDKVAEAKKFIGARCTELQTKLDKIGYKLTIDGDLGINTYNAIIDFQSKNSLVIDGLFGAQSFAKLDAIIASLNVVKPTSQPQPSQSNSNSKVLAYQKAFNTLGLGNLSTDGILGNLTLGSINNLPMLTVGSINAIVGWIQGIVGCGQDNAYGNITKERVITYQSAHGLQADGICGHITITYMLTH